MRKLRDIWNTSRPLSAEAGYWRNARTRGFTFAWHSVSCTCATCLETDEAIDFFVIEPEEIEVLMGADS